MIAYFDRFSISLTKKQAFSASHSGDCSTDIEALLAIRSIYCQLAKIHLSDLRAELSEYGAWSPEELSDNSANLKRILWIACGNIREDIHSKK